MVRWWLADILFTSARLFSFNTPLGNHLSLFHFQAALAKYKRQPETQNGAAAACRQMATNRA
ncbi:MULTISPECIES: hypothetical protein [Kingella]|uniref:Uncharacterized protein n=1 Tax=Kingella bonacorsii TaxID=2796361 RepID=A0ABS1BS81_9NEIS|nr:MULTISPECIES: hypothetical protein [Kingella]MBK0396146.1 hypothetical protein [Kingella bonacorsii]QMT42463.1 hypothetical protein H3L93_10865 [Kingella oralis]